MQKKKNIACNELPKKVTVIDTNKPRKKQAIILKLMRLKVKHPELVIQLKKKVQMIMP